MKILNLLETIGHGIVTLFFTGVIVALLFGALGVGTMAIHHPIVILYIVAAIFGLYGLGRMADWAVKKFGL